jgi:serine/threonine-protein kinase
MADSPAATIGEIVNGRYEIMERLGEGSYFQVFKARDRVQNRMAALKLLRSDLARQSAVRERLVAEGSAAANLVHPNIARVYEASRTDNSAYLAAEFVRGMTLKDRLRRTAPLPVAVAVDIAIAIAEALEFAHNQGVTHCDLRSHNILITAEGQVKVTDFGVSQVIVPAETEGYPSLRAVHYMSPEVAEGSPPTPASDIYSLGVILYEMLTAILPYEGDTAIAVALKLAKDNAVAPSRINTAIPSAMDGIVLKCLQKDPARRYRNVSALLKDLRAAQDALRFGRPLNFTPGDFRVPVVEEEVEEEEVPRSISTLSTLNRVLFAIVVLGLGTVAILAWTLLFKSNPDIRVPQVKGLDQAAALKRIEELGLVPRVQEEWSDNVDAGKVFKTFPPAGKAIKAGSDLNVWVSKGPEKVQVPDVTQNKTDDALRALRDAGLALGHMTQEYNELADKGIITSQDPEAGKTVTPGTKVNLVKSMGPEPTVETAPPPEPVTPPIDETVPANPDTTSDTTEPAPTGPQRQFQVHVDVPQGNDPQLIQIEVTDDTGAHIRYVGQHHPGESFDRIVKGTGDSIVLRVYADGQVIFEDRRGKKGAP